VKGFKFQPVAWMTTILTILTAVEAVNETSAHFIPDKVNVYVLTAIAVLTAILGKLAHDRATPVADPKTTIDGEVVPLTVAPADVPARASSSVPDPQR